MIEPMLALVLVLAPRVLFVLPMLIRSVLSVLLVLLVLWRFDSVRVIGTVQSADAGGTGAVSGAARTSGGCLRSKSTIQTGYAEPVLSVTSLDGGLSVFGRSTSSLLEIVKAFNLLQCDVFLE